MKFQQRSDPLSEEAMPALVRRGLQRFRETSAPDPVAWQSARTTFLNEAHQFAAERVTFGPVARRKGWVGRTFHALIPSFREANPMVVVLKVALILSLVTGAGAGVVAAAQGSLPGSPIYMIKITWEDAQAHFSTTPEMRMEQALKMAQTRVNEVQQLAERGQDIPEQVIERYALHLNAAIQAMVELPVAMQTQIRARIQEQLALHEKALGQIQERLQQRAGDDTPVREMAGILQRTRDRLQDPQGEPPTTRPPEPPRAPNPETPAPGPGGNGGGPGGPDPTETSPRPDPNPGEPVPGIPGVGPGEPGTGPGPLPTEAAPGPGEPGKIGRAHV